MHTVTARELAYLDEVVVSIFRLIGSHKKLNAMFGAHSFVKGYFYDPARPGIQFKFPRSNKINCCQIVLNLTRCYRNLNTGNMSLTQQINKSWILVGHTDNLVIKYPRFYVSERGRQRVLKDKRKNVHAYCEGILIGMRLSTMPPLKEIHYCPYSQSYFSWKETGTPLVTADLIVAIDNQVLCTTDIRQPQLSLF